MAKEIEEGVWDNTEPIEITTELLLRCVEKLNEKCRNKLRHSKNRVNLCSAPMERDQSRHHHSWGYEVGSDDTRTSIKFAKTPFGALALDRSTIHTLTDEEVDFVLDYIAAFTNVAVLYEQTKIKYASGSKNRAYYWKLMEAQKRGLERYRPSRI